MNEAAENIINMQSATQLKEAGKNLHCTPDYAKDPFNTIREFVEPFLPMVLVGPAKLLVATYRQPERTAGGLIKTTKYREEDKYQGVVGLVLKKGPLVFEDDSRLRFGGFKVGEWTWVIFKPENGHATELRGLHCRIIEDVNIVAMVEDPELLW